MAFWPPQEVRQGHRRRLAYFWFAVLLVAYVIYCSFAIAQAASRWQFPNTRIGYSASDMPFPTLSLCHSNAFDSPNYKPFSVTASCFDARNENSPVTQNRTDVSLFPLQPYPFDQKRGMMFASLPGDCAVTVVYKRNQSSISFLPGANDYDVCYQFATDRLPGIKQGLGKQTFVRATTGLVRLTLVYNYDDPTAPPPVVEALSLRSAASKGFFGATEQSETLAAEQVQPNAKAGLTPTFMTKEFVNGTKVVLQSWTLSQSQFNTIREYPGQVLVNSTVYQVAIFGNELGVLEIVESSAINVTVLLSQFAAAWGAVMLFFGMLFAKNEDRTFVFTKSVPPPEDVEKGGPFSS